MIKKTMLAVCVFSLITACDKTHSQASTQQTLPQQTNTQTASAQTTNTQASAPQASSPNRKIAEAETEGVDWTPLFKPWEKECNSSKQLDALFDSMVPVPDPNSEALFAKEPEELQKIKFKAGKIKLPEIYQSAILSNPNLKMDFVEGSYEITVSTSGYYYGMPVVEIFAARGIANGLYFNAIKLDMPVDKARNVLSKKTKIKRDKVDDLDEVYGIQLQKVKEDASQTYVSCDFSN